MSGNENRNHPRPLTQELGTLEGFKRPVGPPPEMKLSAQMQAVMAAEAAQKEARKPLAELFQTGEAEANGLRLPYRVYVPGGLEAGRVYPMVVFLHGGGELGDDNLAHLIANEGALCWVRDQLTGGGEKCFVLAMQCPNRSLDQGADQVMGWMEPHLLTLAAAMEELEAKYPVDENRLYLTGMSMGGGGAWRMNWMFQNRFAAVAPMCAAIAITGEGGIHRTAVRQAAEAFVGKPLWVFHGADDFVVTPETSRVLVEELEGLGQKRDRDFYYTEYPAACGYNHACWAPAYGDPSFRRWLFAQKL